MEGSTVTQTLRRRSWQFLAAIAAGLITLLVFRNLTVAGLSAALAGLSAGWQHDDATQFDLGANLGLNRTSADAQVYVGVARRF